MSKKKVTEEDLKENPALIEAGVKAGDEIEITDNGPEAPELNPIDLIIDPIKATPAPAPTPVIAAPVVLTNEERAEAIFQAMPHIHTVWFDNKGEWRFYETPGTVAVEKSTPLLKVDTSNL